MIKKQLDKALVLIDVIFVLNLLYFVALFVSQIFTIFSPSGGNNGASSSSLAEQQHHYYDQCGL